MKKLAIEHLHQSLGAKMHLYADYLMPIEYSGVLNEHITVRTKAGLFDVSHMGEFWAKGPGAIKLIQSVITNDISLISIGQAQYSCMPNGRGGIVDDLIIYRYEDQKYMLVVNAANMEKDWDWINKHNSFNAELENSSDKTGMFAIQGPEAINCIQKLTSVDLKSIKPFHFTTAEFAGDKNVIISNTGYTGAGGFEVYFNITSSEMIWNDILSEGKPFGLLPIGLAARDTLRLEMGYCLYGNDINDSTSPLEAALDWIIRLNKKESFVDKEFLIKQKAEGIKRKLSGFEMIDKGIPRHGYEIYNEDNILIGHVTSGTMSPMLKKGIGMGYVKIEHSNPGSIIQVKIRDKLLKAKIVKYPFYHK